MYLSCTFVKSFAMLCLMDDQAKNHNFTQVADGYMDDYARLIQRNPAAASLLMFFASRMGRLNNAVVMSYRSMMELTGYSRPTIVNALKVLKSENWLDSVKIGSIKAYGLNERFVWKAANNQRHYAEFSAICIAAASEQEPKREAKAQSVREKLRYLPVIEATQ